MNISQTQGPLNTIETYLNVVTEILHFVSFIRYRNVNDTAFFMYLTMTAMQIFCSLDKICQDLSDELPRFYASRILLHLNS